VRRTADSTSSRPASRALPRLFAGLLAAALLALGASACGGSVGHTEGGDRAAGKALFTEGVGGAPSCGSCHALADAGTTAEIGPDLDAAFTQSRENGLGESTIQQVVVDQIFYPTEVTPTGAPGMPAADVTLPECTEDMTEGCVPDQKEAAQNIGAYVASVAGTGATPSPTPPAPSPPSPPAGGGGSGAEEGKEVFASAGCGSCHTLADAGSTGQIGPNLDDAKPSEELVVDRVTNGQGAMPPFKDQLSAEQIDAVAAYVASAAGS
jgi:mono/diheme cytochrome c family protein